MSDFSRIGVPDSAPRRSFNHRAARRVVEVDFHDYHRNKNEIIIKLHNRILWLSWLAVAFGLIELVLYIIIVRLFVATNVLFRKPVLGVPLNAIYLIYWGSCAAVSAHGFYLYFGWKQALECGTNLVMHCRLFELLSLVWTVIAFWLLVSIFYVFGFLDVGVLGANAENIQYTIATSVVAVHLIICPWFIRTVHSKTTQIDDLFASEYLGKTTFRHVNVAPMVDELDDIAAADDKESAHEPSGRESSEEAPSVAEEPIQFALDASRKLKKAAFWDLWKKTEVAGSFSCNFKNAQAPTLKEVTAHLTKAGFHVVSHNESKDVLEVYLYGHPVGVDIAFVAEFVFVYSRQFFQSTFKCEDKDLAPDFVKHFQLQDLMETTD
ncbi:transmembrane protein [Achlya hypogyna]|uniref:Transmembrane protein n=1 Tax=Achlya hypogyna TaxID=1202772 RepID=A0A1V9YBU4_ACHHY|nr:transmembrane protein [Achlya hypogyna]